jgi:hypothetical protein
MAKGILSPVLAMRSSINGCGTEGESEKANEFVQRAGSRCGAVAAFSWSKAAYYTLEVLEEPCWRLP